MLVSLEASAVVVVVVVGSFDSCEGGGDFEGAFLSCSLAVIVFLGSAF